MLLLTNAISPAMLSNWATWAPIAIAAISLVISFVSAALTILGFMRGRPKLTVTQSDGVKQSVVIEPEWDPELKHSPDVYVNRRYRVLMEVTLRNQSSNPISISTFTLNNRFRYGAYSLPGVEYQVEERSGTHKFGSGGVAFGSSNRAVFPINDQWIKPVVTLQPFGIVKGYLFWPIFEDDLQYINIGGKNTLQLETTFKTVSADVEITELIKRDPELPKRDSWDKSSPSL